MRALGLAPPRPPRSDASRMEGLRDLWAGAGLDATETRDITVHRTFADALTKPLRAAELRMLSWTNVRIRRKETLRALNEGAGFGPGMDMKRMPSRTGGVRWNG
jgi:hypothetical protein